MGEYTDQLKKTNPDAYKKLSGILAGGEKANDWQAQIFTPLDTSKIKSYSPEETKEWFKSVQVPEVVTDGDSGQQYVVGYHTEVKPTDKFPKDVQPTYNTSGEDVIVTGYTKPAGTINGMPITATFDASGKPTGFTGDQSLRNWVSDNQSYGGQWDASGKPIPHQYVSSSGSFVSNFLSSDLGKIATVVAMAYGVPVVAAALEIPAAAATAALNVGTSVAKGVPLDQAIESAAKSAAVNMAGAEVSSASSPEFLKAGLSPDQAATASNIAGQVTKTAITGGDPLQALISGGVGAGVGAITSQIEGFSDMSKSQQAAVNSAVSKSLQGKDPTLGLVNAALNEGVKAAQEYKPSATVSTEDTTTTDKTITAAGVDESYLKNLSPDELARYKASQATEYVPGTAKLPAQDLGATQENTDEYQKNLQNIWDAGGFTSQWKPTQSGGHTYKSDDGSTITLDDKGAVSGYTEAKPGMLLSDLKSAAKTPAVSLSKPADVVTPAAKPDAAGLAALASQQQAPTPIEVANFQGDLSLSDPLDVGYFSNMGRKQTAQKDTQSQDGTVKIASGGYMDDLLELLHKRG
jgi:hypothetical protein